MYIATILPQFITTSEKAVRYKRAYQKRNCTVKPLIFNDSSMWAIQLMFQSVLFWQTLEKYDTIYKIHVEDLFLQFFHDKGRRFKQIYLLGFVIDNHSGALFLQHVIPTGKVWLKLSTSTNSITRNILNTVVLDSLSVFCVLAVLTMMTIEGITWRLKMCKM